MMRHKWSEEEKNALKAFVPGHSFKEIINQMEMMFGWRPTKSQITNMKTKLKIKSNVRYGYVKGHIPHNKGKHYQPGGRSSETWFKKGQMPIQHKPVGTKRITCDGYHMVKVADPNIWRMEHELVYEHHYGAIPKGRFVIFLDRDRDNLDIDNLIDVSRAELLKINNRKILDYPKELKRPAIIAIRLEEIVRTKRVETSKRK